MAETQKLADFVQPSLTASRVEAQWRRISERDSTRARVNHRMRYAMGALAATLLVIGSFRYLGESGPLTSGVRVEHLANGEDRIALSEGVVVGLAREAKLAVEKRSSTETWLRLEHGEADFEVTHQDSRRVVVATPRFDIEVVGTSFHVAVTGASASPEVSVHVRRGTVKVRANASGVSAADVRSLSTGESWSSGAALPLKERATAEPVASVFVPELVNSVVAKDAAVAPTNPSGSAGNGSAKELFETAERHRLAGRLRDAATALDAIRRFYPTDPRAALAAFELGRIRLDGLGDPAGALSAFQSALRINPNAAFREDIEARVVKLHERLGQTAACKTAKASYLARYPRGSHVVAVESACAH